MIERIIKWVVKRWPRNEEEGRERILDALASNPDGMRFERLREKSRITRSWFNTLLKREIDEGLVEKSGNLYHLTEKGRRIINEKNAIQYFRQSLSELALQPKYSGSLLWAITHPLLADERARFLEHYVASLYVKAPQTPADPNSDLIRNVSDAWSIAGSPEDVTLNQRFSWPKAVRDALEEIGAKKVDAKSREGKASRLVAQTIRGHNTELFEELRRYTVSPGRWMWGKRFEPLVRLGAGMLAGGLGGLIYGAITATLARLVSLHTGVTFPELLLNPLTYVGGGIGFALLYSLLYNAIPGSGPRAKGAALGIALSAIPAASVIWWAVQENAIGTTASVWIPTFLLAAALFGYLVGSSWHILKLVRTRLTQLASKAAH